MADFTPSCSAVSGAPQQGDCTITRSFRIWFPLPLKPVRLAASWFSGGVHPASAHFFKCISSKHGLAHSLTRALQGLDCFFLGPSRYPPIASGFTRSLFGLAHHAGCAAWHLLGARPILPCSKVHPRCSVISLACATHRPACFASNCHCFHASLACSAQSALWYKQQRHALHTKRHMFCAQPGSHQPQRHLRSR